MQAPRYRLRFVTGVALSSRTYGSGTYGEGTYGEQASDPLSALLYYVVPWPGGYLSDPAWIYRQNDVMPSFKVSVRSHAGPLDLTGLATAYLELTNTDGLTTAEPWMFILDVATEDGLDWLVRDWAPTDLSNPGTYRAGIVITYESGRRLSVPIDDRLHFVVNPNTIIPEGDPQDFRWDDARWDYARWSARSHR